MVKSLIITVGFVIFLSLAFVLLGNKNIDFIRTDNKNLGDKISASKETPFLPVTTSVSEPSAQNKDSSQEVSRMPVKKEILVLPPQKTEIDFPEKPVATSTVLATTTEVFSPVVASLPPLDEEALFKAVVKIQCPADDGLSKYVGSGFVLKGGIVATAAHVVQNSAGNICDVIFPSDRRPTYYFKGAIVNLKEVARRHDEEGIDFAILKLPEIDSYIDAKAIFAEYPYIPYPVCENPKMFGDKLFHFGYPSNYADQNYLSGLRGESVVYEDIKGIKDALSEDQTFSYRTPIFSSTYDETKMHPYMVSRVASFYGDSGGLAFNKDKQCILGPHRGGTIGKSSGENYSIFMLMGWDKAGNFY